jgi:hypothetical protein
MKKGTKTTLLRDLRLLPPSPERDRIIERAESGLYHDFRSKSREVPPKVLLLDDLHAAGFETLADRTLDGEYDEAGDDELVPLEDLLLELEEMVARSRS